MSKVRCQLFVRGPDGSGAGAIKKYIDCALVIRDSDVGSWSVTGVPLGKLLDLAEPGSALVVERDGDELMAGPFDVDERAWSSNSDTITLSGYSDEISLWDRIGYPCAPSGTSGTVFSTAAYDVEPNTGTGPAETVIKNFVRANAVTGGAWVGADRAVSGLSIAADQGRGSSIKAQTRFDILGDLLASLAVQGGDLGFEIKRGVFDVYQHQDLSDQVVFDRSLKNLYGYTIKRRSPSVTHVVVAGGGDLTARTFQLLGDPVAAARWQRRIELFRDRRDTTDLTQMYQTGVEELFNGQEAFEATLYPKDGNRAEFGVAYGKGDTVTVAEQKCVMRTIKITLNESGETVEPQPSVSSLTADALLEVFDSVRSVQRQVLDLQRSQ